ncbi:MAG: MFS transporter, partial [Firmicutes bacterium]|nr:MFS transporter [Bacillota bacterium]
MVLLRELFAFQPATGWRSDKNRLVLALLTFSLWLGASAILPMLPLYLSKSGSGSFGVGVVMSAYYIGAVVTQIPVGKLVDRIGPPPVIVVGLCIFGLSSILFAP